MCGPLRLAPLALAPHSRPVLLYRLVRAAAVTDKLGLVTRRVRASSSIHWQAQAEAEEHVHGRLSQTVCEELCWH